ncbi:acyl-CoA dehydratase activase [Paenibacillus sp. M1]|uniref:Acyl-CoA dehydratase activase n=1 Tax=Paenibacillus haidiansis TaxID=1574488 RepID=A0ABU7VQ83_9BACL
MYLGIDVGSVSTDAVLLDEESRIVAYSIEKSGFDHKQAIRNATDRVCEAGGVLHSDIRGTAGTGYGRRNVEGACVTVTEITCHAKGIAAVYPEVRTLIDIGGQDSKVIRIMENGFAENFIMNDKCAAGTGRFLEVMAHTMGVETSQLGPLSLKAKKPRPISSICTVFAESEVISRISEGCPLEEIIAGIHQAIGDRLLAMFSSIGVVHPVALTGGVAKNSGVVKAISDRLGRELLIPNEPQITGALGAAILAREYGS